MSKTNKQIWSFKNTIEIFKTSQLSHLFRMEPVRATLLLIAILATAGLEMISISVVMPVLGAMLGETQIPYLEDLLKRLGDTPSAQLQWLAIGLFAVILLKSIAQFFRIRLGSQLSWSLFKRWADGVMRAAMQSDMTSLHNRRQGEHLTLINETASAAKGSVILISAISNLAIGLVLLLASTLVNWKWSLFCIGIAGPMFILLRKLSREMSTRLGKDKMISTMQMNSEANENLLAARLLKAYDLVDRRMRDFAEATSAIVISTVNYDSRRALLDPMTEILIAVFVSAGLFWMGSRGQVEIQTAVPMIAFFVISFRRSVSYLSTAIQEMMNASYFAHSKSQIMKEIHYDGTPRITVGGDQSGLQTVQSLAGEIRLDHVTFSYEPGRTPLKDVSIRIPHQKLTVLVGPSGVGKSTICDLLLGFITPDSGRVLVGSRDLRDLDKDSWRRRVAYVSQETILLNGTIEDNLRISRPEATREDIERAAKLARIHEYISSLPSGYSTHLGERGLKISGGQRQRLALARALLRDPDLFILDEPTSALDRNTEIEIEQEILTAIRGKTTVIVTHGDRFRAQAAQVIDLAKIAEASRSHAFN